MRKILQNGCDDAIAVT